MPGATPNTGSRATDGFSLNGNRTFQNKFLVDGVDNNNYILGVDTNSTQAIRPSVDAIQEFKVESANYSAEHGQAAGGVITVAIKSGTNELHGSAFEFLRNDKLDANDWFANRAQLARPPPRYNQFGGALGGPVWRNHTFFFGSYQGARQHNSTTSLVTVPTPEQTRGNFGGVNIYDPANMVGGNRLQFADNVIPENRMDPVGRKIAALYPAPNQPGTVNSYASIVPQTDDANQYDFRGDHNFSERDKLFGRFSKLDRVIRRGGICPAPGNCGVFATFPLDLINDSWSLAFGETRVFSANAVNELRVGYSNNQNDQLSPVDRSLYDEFGIKGVPSFEGLTGLPTFGVTNYTGLGNRTFTPNPKKAELWQVNNNFSWFRGAHALKFGGEFWRFNGNEVNRQFASGQFAFAPTPTQGRNAQGQLINNSGLPLASFLLGIIDSVNSRVDAGIGKRSFYLAGYVNDDWKLSQRFTLNLGLRYEVESPVTEVGNRMNNFDPRVPHPLAGKTVDGQLIPGGTRGVLTFPGRNGYGERLWEWDRNNFAPRIGLAWRPFNHHRTVVRAGFGIFFGSPYNREVIQQQRLGFGGVANFRTPVPFTLREGLPPGALQSPSEQDLTPEFGAIGTPWPQQQIQFINPERSTNYTQNFNLTIGQQVKEIAFEFGYLGNLGRHVPFPNINLNHIPTELLSRTEIPVRLRRPYPQFPGDTAQVQILSPNWGLSNYHAFVLKSEKRAASGFGWLFTYTLSKWIDNVVFVGGDDVTFGDDDQVQNIYDLRHERSLSTNDIRHRLVISPIYELPFGKGKRWFRDGFLNRAFGGWSLSTIATLQSGSPFGVTVLNGPRDILGDNADGKNLRPDIVGDPRLPDSQKGQPATGGVRGIQWFNPAAFAAPARFTYGNASRTVMTGPGRVNFDTAILKNFAFTEQFRLQFRFEMFNAFNIPQFGLPGNTLGASRFGIAGAGGSNRELQFGLKLFF